MEKKDLFGLTREDRSRAYAAIKERYNLKAQQRTQLDHCLSYSLLMMYAKNKAWDHVATVLKQEGIVA